MRESLRIDSPFMGAGDAEGPILVTLRELLLSTTVEDRCVATRGSRAFRGQRGVGGKVAAALVSAEERRPRSRAAGAFRRWKSSRSRFWI